MNQNSWQPVNIGGAFRGAIHLGAFIQVEFPVDKELLRGMIREKSIGLISGPRGSGKSWNPIIFVYAIAAEKPAEPWGTEGCMAVLVTMIYADNEPYVITVIP